VNNNNQIAYLKDDIKLNCNPAHQRLRFNLTNLNSFSISVQNPPKENDDQIPVLGFLNVSGNQLTSFCDNSLPNLE
jgi:hypothetical protein